MVAVADRTQKKGFVKEVQVEVDRKNGDRVVVDMLCLLVHGTPGDDGCIDVSYAFCSSLVRNATEAHREKVSM